MLTGAGLYYCRSKLAGFQKIDVIGSLRVLSVYLHKHKKNCCDAFEEEKAHIQKRRELSMQSNSICVVEDLRKNRKEP